MKPFNFGEIRDILTRNFCLGVRFLFVHSNFHLFFPRWITGSVSRFAYRTELSRWINKHPSQEFNDRGYHNREYLYQFVLETEDLKGGIDYLEFGAAGGYSLRWWVENNKDPRSRFIGFDTFTGLPENWDNVPKGTFSSEGRVPDIKDNRCKYEIGLFQDTLFGFLERFKLERKTVVHIDCNLYSSTLFVFTSLAPKIKKNDIIILDDFGSIMHPTHGFRAFCDFISAYKLNYKLIGASNFYRQIAIKLI